MVARRPAAAFSVNTPFFVQSGCGLHRDKSFLDMFQVLFQLDYNDKFRLSDTAAA